MINKKLIGSILMSIGALMLFGGIVYAIWVTSPILVSIFGGIGMIIIGCFMVDD